MRDYFDAEMRLLQEAAQEFASAHPEQARMLNLGELRDRDPYIERLLEGMAYLIAHVRQRVDESREAISEQLLAQVCPAQILPYPSCTVVQFSPVSWRQAAQKLPAGLELLSRPVGDSAMACRFTTTRSLRLHPLKLARVDFSEADNGATRLGLTVEVHGSTPPQDMGLDELDFFLHADSSLALALRALLTDNQVRVSLSADARPVTVAQPLGFCPIGLGDEGRLLPRPASGHPGFDLLQDYFCARERYLFVRLNGLARARWPEKTKTFTIEIVSPQRLPAGHKLGTEHLRLFCVPAVNLFPMDSEPVELDCRRTEYRLVADARRPLATQVYRVDQVATRGQRSGVVTECVPLQRLRETDGQTRYYQVTRHDHGVGNADAYVQVTAAAGSEPETLSAEITATNGHLPRRHLHEGQLDVAGPNVPNGIRFANLTRPSACLNPPNRNDYPSRLHTFLAVSVGSLAHAQSLRGLLRLMDWSGRRANQRRIDAVIEVGVEPVSRLRRGMLMTGLALTVVIDEDGFTSPADMQLFGDVLHAFFSVSAAINEFVTTRLVTRTGQQEFIWEAQTGRNCPI